MAGRLDGRAAGLAEAVPERSAVRVIELAPPDAEEKTPVISSVALDPAGKLLAAVGDDHLVRVFDIQSGKILYRWKSHTDWVKASAFRPDGQVLATSGADRRIRSVGRAEPRPPAQPVRAGSGGLRPGLQS